jgi:formamidopyrimidine-DNA glycosylase
MPEGPEVAYMAYMLQKKFGGARLKKITIRGGRYKRHGAPTGFKAFLGDLPLVIQHVGNKGKLFYVEFKGFDQVLVVTLGLTGHFVLKESHHSHYLFETNKGRFYMEDMRNFGTLSLMTRERLQKRLEKLGPDMLGSGKDITFGLFLERMRLAKNRQKQIAVVLLDQSVICGVGNYVRSEAFYQAGISPFVKVGRLSDGELKRLYLALHKILQKAFRYAKREGKFYRLFQVYKRSKTAKGEKVLHERDAGGRYLYYVKRSTLLQRSR